MPRREEHVGPSRRPERQWPFDDKQNDDGNPPDDTHPQRMRCEWRHDQHAQPRDRRKHCDVSSDRFEERVIGEGSCARKKRDGQEDDASRKLAPQSNVHGGEPRKARNRCKQQQRYGTTTVTSLDGPVRPQVLCARIRTKYVPGTADAVTTVEGPTVSAAMFERPGVEPTSMM